MLIARKNRLLNRLIYLGLIKSGLQGAFVRVNLRQASAVPGSNRPVILYGNHSSWWDGHLGMAVNEERWHLDGYVMMEDKQLQRYSFFRSVGAFSLNRSDTRSAMHTLDYAAELMTQSPGRMLMLFPQGEILGNDVRPLAFFNGIAHLVKKIVERVGQCALYPMALRYEFIGEQKPEAFISIGEPLQLARESLPTPIKYLTGQMEVRLTQELDWLHRDVTMYQFTTFEACISGGWSLNRWWDAIRGRAPMAQVGREEYAPAAPKQTIDDK